MTLSEWKQYWTRRYTEQGDSYVAAGGRWESMVKQAKDLEPIITGILSDGNPSARVLDFGCGPGRFRSAVEAGGHEYAGVDLIEGLGTLPLTYPLPGGPYDAALAIYVLQHIVPPRDYIQAVTGIHGALRPGGRLIVVDHLEMKPGEAHAHMAPRGLEGLTSVADWSLADAVGVYDGHWVGVLVK